MPSQKTPRNRALQLNLSNQEAEELFSYLNRVMNALWDAYDDVLMEGFWREEEVRRHEDYLDEWDRNHPLDAFSDRDIPY